MEQQQADRAHKDPDLQSLRREHSPVWQRVLDIACPTRVKAQCFSHAQPPTHSEHHLAGQGPKQHCPGKSWMQQHVHAVETGSATSCAWTMDGSPKTSSMERELVQGKRPTGRPQLRFRDVCKRDLKPLNIDQNNWEATALRRSAWRQTVQNGLSNFEETLAQQHREKENEKKGCSPCRQASVRLRLCPL